MRCSARSEPSLLCSVPNTTMFDDVYFCNVVLEVEELFDLFLSYMMNRILNT
jgi:hypothetical protein